MERLQFDGDEANTNHIARHGVRPEEAEQVIANEPLQLKAVDPEGRITEVVVTASGGDRYRTEV